ncbi:DUF6794 domain-containing protein [Thermodesulfobacteriota bacterium]
MIDWDYPKTVLEAVERFMAMLPLKDRVYIAKMQKEELITLHAGMGSVIQQEFGLATGNIPLIESCRKLIGIPDLSADQCIGVIIESLWLELRKSHSLRIMKNE